MSSTYCAAVYDANGYHKIIVNPSFDFELDNDGFNPAGCVQARILRSTFEALAPPVFIDGVVYYHALNKAVVAQVTSLNATIGARLQAIIDATTTALGVPAVTTPLRIGNSITVDGVTYTLQDQGYNAGIDVPGVGEFGDWPGHPGAIKITGVGGQPLITGVGGDNSLALLWSITSATAIMTGARTTFVASVADGALVNYDASISDDPPNLISQGLNLQKSEDPVSFGPDVLSAQFTFPSAQTAMTADMSGVALAAGTGSISYVTLGFII